MIDTYNVLESGVKNAIRVAKEVLEPNGHRLKGVRIDSGDLAYLTKKTRKMLDEAGCEDCKIVVSNSIDEYLITSLNEQGAKIDSYGVGERMITAKSEPVFGGVYKLAAVENEDGEYIPRIKISENVEKITNPGFKKLWRIYDKDTGYGIADVITMADETINDSEPYPYMDEIKPWKKRKFENFRCEELQKQIFKGGELVYELPTLEEIREKVKTQLTTSVWAEEQRFDNPHKHYVDLSVKLYNIKQDLLSKLS